MSENIQTPEIKDEPILTTPETTAPKDGGNDTDPDPYCCTPGNGNTGPDGTP